MNHINCIKVLMALIVFNTVVVYAQMPHLTESEKSCLEKTFGRPPADLENGGSGGLRPSPDKFKEILAKCKADDSAVEASPVETQNTTEGNVVTRCEACEQAKPNPIKDLKEVTKIARTENVESAAMIQRKKRLQQRLLRIIKRSPCPEPGEDSDIDSLANDDDDDDKKPNFLNDPEFMDIIEEAKLNKQEKCEKQAERSARKEKFFASIGETAGEANAETMKSFKQSSAQAYSQKGYVPNYQQPNGQQANYLASYSGYGQQNYFPNYSNLSLAGLNSYPNYQSGMGLYAGNNLSANYGSSNINSLSNYSGYSASYNQAYGLGSSILNTGQPNFIPTGTVQSTYNPYNTNDQSSGYYGYGR